MLTQVIMVLRVPIHYVQSSLVLLAMIQVVNVSDKPSDLGTFAVRVGDAAAVSNSAQSTLAEHARAVIV